MPLLQTAPVPPAVVTCGELAAKSTAGAPDLAPQSNAPKSPATTNQLWPIAAPLAKTLSAVAMYEGDWSGSQRPQLNETTWPGLSETTRLNATRNFVSLGSSTMYHLITAPGATAWANSMSPGVSPVDRAPVGQPLPLPTQTSPLPAGKGGQAPLGVEALEVAVLHRLR